MKFNSFLSNCCVFLPLQGFWCNSYFNTFAVYNNLNISSLLLNPPGIHINNTHIQLEDASIGTAVIALTGVPHDVDDLLVANILSSFGTILG